MSAIFSYGQLERALAAIHGVTPATFPTFKARIKHFQRIGVAPSAPGKGRRISYTIEDAIYWALCLELAEAGLSPTSIKLLMQNHGYGLLDFFPGANERADHFLYIRADLLSLHLAGSQSSYEIGILTAAELRARVFSRPEIARMVIINLSTLKRRLGEQLGIGWKTMYANGTRRSCLRSRR